MHRALQDHLLHRSHQSSDLWNFSGAGRDNRVGEQQPRLVCTSVGLVVWRWGWSWELAIDAAGGTDGVAATTMDRAAAAALGTSFAAAASVARTLPTRFQATDPAV
jgi:hypothetical protein